MRRVMAWLLLAGLAPAASAQFDQFAWTLKGNPSGSGFVTNALLHVTGPGLSCEPELGLTTWLETVAPYGATVSVLVDFTTLDWPCDVYDNPVWVIDGVKHELDVVHWCDGTYQFDFDVAMGQAFGFGIWSMDCGQSPDEGDLGDFHDLVITPHVWQLVGAPIDPQSGPSLPGSAADRLGDVDGDGSAEFVTGDPGLDTVTVWSGNGGEVVFEVTGSASLGQCVVGAGDMDGDGVSDFAAGEPQSSIFGAPGKVHAWRGSDGTELFIVKGTASSKLGSELAGPGDVDGDGFADIAVRSSKSGEQVRLLGGPDGHLIATIGSTTPGQLFGVALAGPGDVDLDGVPDLLVGTPTAIAAGTGTAQLYSGASWTPLHEFVGSSEDFGRGVSGAGDLDLDGSPDLLVSDESSTGAISAFSGATGMSFFQIHGTVGASLGAAVDGGSDLTGDGAPDFVTVTDSSPPVLQVRSGSGGDLLVELPGPSTATGGDLAILGDIDGSGTEDVALIPGGGGVQVFKALDGLGAPFLEGFGDIAPNAEVELTIIDGLPGGFALLLLGPSGAQVPMLGGILQPAPEAALPLFLLPDGSGSVQGRWPTGLPAFSTIWMQAWIMDPAGPQGWTCTNGLIATQVGD